MNWKTCLSSNFSFYSFLILLGFSFNQQICTADPFSSRQEQLQRITKYDIIVPKRSEGRYRREVNTLQEDGHIKEPSFILPIEGEEYILDLYLNDALFADGYLERTYSSGHIPTDTLPHRTHHCYYHGTVRGTNSSQVALSTCNGLSGYIALERSTFYLEPLQDSPTEHLIYRPENTIREKPLYTFEEDYPPDFEERGELRLRELEEHSHERVRRNNVHDEIKYIEIIMVADSKMLERRGTRAAVQQKLKNVVNIMDSIYKALNTRVVLASVIVWGEDPYEVSTNPSRALSQFQRWRENNLVPSFSHDNAQMVTGLGFEGSTVGMAALNTMCSRDQSCGVSQEHGNMDNDLASTIAHEMGHNMGLNHDTSKCTCAANQNVGCVMAASSGGTPPLLWSSCSREMYAKNLERGLGACMFNYPKTIYDGPICQNGFIEDGEECDCGTPEECDNPCCIPETCRLHVNATCAFGECCEDCQLKEAGNLCRDMMNDCDLPEFCNGKQEECPGNVYRQNGETCQHSVSDVASCFNGMCMSYDDQCEAIWGDGASTAHSKCWRYNTQSPSAFGNCGVNEDGSYIRCSREHKMCGKLLCEGGEAFPVLGSLASASQGYIFDENGVKRLCKSASLDQGDDIPDPGYVADGSPCAAKMFCYEHKCVNHSFAGIVPCPENCNSNGVCNSENHCHCDDGWSWPTCGVPGDGGSEDSGPTVPETPDILTTTLMETPLQTTKASAPSSPLPPGTGHPSVPPTATFYTPLGTTPTPAGVTMMVILAVVLVAAVAALLIFVIWKRDAIKRKLACKRLKAARSFRFRAVHPGSPKHSPPLQPTAPFNVVIEHPAHISGGTNHTELPPSYESHHYANTHPDDLRPARVAPTAPPAKTAPNHGWSNGGVNVTPFNPKVRYQKTDDPVMYDEPPKVDFVDPSIPRPSSTGDDYIPEEPEESAPSPSSYDQSPTPRIQFRLPSAPVTKPSQVAPPPPVKPSSNGSIPSQQDTQEPQNPFGQAALKPTGFAGFKLPDPASEQDPKPPSQAVLKPANQNATKPVPPTPLKPPGQAALRPPGQAALKPPAPPTKPTQQGPTPVLPASKPAPAARKPPVLPSKPTVPSKPSAEAVTPKPRPALRPVGLSSNQENWNNSASTEAPSEEAGGPRGKVGPRNSFRGGPKPQMPPPPPPNKGKPAPPPKPVNV